MANTTQTPAQIEAWRKCQGHCAAARPKAALLKELGLLSDEDEQRLAHLDQMAARAIEIHDQELNEQRRGKR